MQNPSIKSAWRRAVPPVVAAITAAVGAASANAATSWTNPLGGIWQTAANWDNGVPAATVDTLFNLPDAYTTTLAADATAKTLTVSAGSLTLVPNSYSLTAAGVVAVSGGTLTFLGTAVAGTPAGAAAVGGTGIVVSGGTFNLSGLDTSAGTLTFTGGAINVSGGAFKPKAVAAVVQTAPAVNETFANGLIISGTASATARPTLGLTGGASATATYISAVTDGSIFIGLSGGRGGAAVGGAGSTLNTPAGSGRLYVGSGGRTTGGTFAGGDGTLALAAGGQAVAYDSVRIGYAGGTGRVTVDGATSRLASANGSMLVGASRYGPAGSATAGAAGDGELSLAGGAQAACPFSVMIGYLGGTGRASVDGVGSKLASTTAGLYVGVYRYGGSTGPAGDGTLALTVGGQASGVTTVVVGGQGSVGRATVDGVGSKLAATAGDLLVGYFREGPGTGPQGDGTLAVTAGAQAASYNATFVGSGGGIGGVTVDGVGVGGVASRLDAGAGLLVGSSIYGAVGETNGRLAVSAGGVAASGTRIGSNAQIGVGGCVGVVDVSSATADTSRWTHIGNAFVGSDGSTGDVGTGTLNVGPGGLVNISGTLNVYAATSTALGQSGGTVNLSGGTLSVHTLTNFGAPARVVWTGGTLQVNASNVTIGPAGTITSQTFGPGKALLVSNDTTLATGGAIVLSGGAVTTGTLTGVTPTNLAFNTGTLKITGGGLNIGPAAALGATPTISAGKTLDVAQTTTVMAGSTLTVSGGTFRSGAANVIGALAVTGGTVQIGTTGSTPALTGAGGIDVRGGTLRVAYTTTSPLAAIRAMLAAGYAQATPFAVGQIRSTTATAAKGLGYGDDGTAVFVRPALYGDATLDGQVDFNDFLVLQANFSAAGTRFDQGNFNYDNVTDFNDFLALQASFGQSLNGVAVAVSAAQVASMAAFARAESRASDAVPEPAAGMAAWAGGCFFARRQTRRAKA